MKGVQSLKESSLKDPMFFNIEVHVEDIIYCLLFAAFFSSKQVTSSIDGGAKFFPSYFGQHSANRL